MFDASRTWKRNFAMLSEAQIAIVYANALGLFFEISFAPELGSSSASSSIDSSIIRLLSMAAVV